MKADAFVDWDWLASETVLKLAPAEPDAVDVEVKWHIPTFKLGHDFL